MRYALINENNEVVNIVLWDGVTELQWPQGCSAVPCTNEHEYQWSAKSISPEQSELNAEQQLLLALLEKYGIPNQ